VSTGAHTGGGASGPDIGAGDASAGAVAVLLLDEACAER